MAQKSFELKNRGMLRDLSISKSSNEYAYENRNIRLTPLDHDTLLSVTNEKGPLKVSNVQLSGTTIGYCVLNNHIVVFTTDNTTDRIYRVDLNDDGSWTSNLLYEGNINLDTEHPIEALGLYESEAIQKVYWVDGKNQPRVINILNSYIGEESNPKFDFITSFSPMLNLSIDKQFNGIGSFSSGVIQYYITYYNKFGQETNIVYSSPQYYLSNEDKGASPEDTVTCSFKLSMTNVDTTFDYMRVYSVIRTSYNGTPTANIVGDIDLSNVSPEDTVSIIDNGVYTSSVDPTILLYIGGVEITASTLTQKDNTLFLGDITNLTEIYDEQLNSLIESFRDSSTRDNYLKFTLSDTSSGYDIPMSINSGYYSYTSQLNNSSYQIKTFKGGETYRIGIRFFTKTGSYSSIYWLGDVFNPYYPEFYTTGYHRAILYFKLPDDILSYLKSSDNNYSQFQLYMAEASQSDRCVIAQGVLSPTVFNLRQRVNDGPFTQSSWFFRFINGPRVYNHFEQIPAMATDVVIPENTGEDIQFTPSDNVQSVEIQGICDSVPVTVNYDGSSTDESHYSYSFKLSVNGYYITGRGNGGFFVATGEWKDASGNTTGSLSISTTPWTAQADGAFVARDIRAMLSNAGIPLSSIPSQQELLDSLWNPVISSIHGNLFNMDRKTGWLTPSGSVSYTESDAKIFTGTTANTPDYAKNAFISKYGNNYYVDSSIFTFHSPDINDNTNDNFGDYHLRIIGYTPITSNISNFKIDASAPENGVKTTYNKVFSTPANTEGATLSGIGSYPLWQDTTINGTQTLYWMYPWHKTGSISGIEIVDKSDPNNPINTGEYYSVLNSKIWANMFYSYRTIFKVPSSITSGSDIGWKNISDGNLIPQDNIRIIGSDINSAYVYEQNNRTYTYQGDCDSILSFDSSKKYPIINTGVENASSPEDVLLNNSYAQLGSYDSVNISYKSSAHALISFNDILKNNSMYRSCLPTIGNSDISGSLDGDLPWETLSGEDYPYYNLMTYTKDSPQFQVEEQSDGSFKILNDSLDEWKKYITPYMDDGADVYFSYIDTSNVSHLMKIISMDIVLPQLNIPSISWDINTETTRTLNVVIHPVANAQKYNIIIKDSLGETAYQNESDTLEYSIEIDESKEPYSISVYAIADGYTNSNTVTEYASEQTLNVSPLSIDIAYDDTSEHSITIESSGNWTITETPSVYSDILQPRSSEGVYVTASEFIPTEECYLNDIRFGNRWEWNVTDKEIISPTGSSSKYISESIGWNLNNDDSNYPFLYIGEIYRDYDPNTAYGGTSKYALKGNTFIPISGRYLIGSGEFYGSEGDTFFQRWDCLKTEPFSTEKENNIIEMVSFMVETHTNIDGRYDTRRGIMDNLSTSSDNINTINTVYTQPDNFVNGYVLDDKASLDTFPTEITWSKTKTMNEDIDTWTNITLASVLDLDGDKGKVTALRRFGNSLIAFQERGISEILFNTRTQMSTVEGVPVELANSGKVDGKRYISDKIGCINKYSIVEASSGIYFIDNVNSSISLFNGSIQSISNVKGFKAWMQQHNTTDLWNPKTFKNYIGFYDRANDDIYFVSSDEALCFNEMLSEFTSFYSYGGIPVMATVNNKFIAISNTDGYLYEMHEGEYNKYFNDISEPFSITYKVTPDPYTDKTFTNIEYKADVFDSDNNLIPEYTFNTLDVWNEYQKGSTVLDFKTPQLSNLKRKYRNWAAFIPRDTLNNKYGYNRIRNPWIYLKLEMNENLDNTRMEFHNLIVRYI